MLRDGVLRRLIGEAAMLERRYRSWVVSAGTPVGRQVDLWGEPCSRGCPALAAACWNGVTSRPFPILHVLCYLCLQQAESFIWRSLTHTHQALCSRPRPLPVHATATE